MEYDPKLVYTIKIVESYQKYELDFTSRTTILKKLPFSFISDLLVDCNRAISREIFASGNIYKRQVRVDMVRYNGVSRSVFYYDNFINTRKNNSSDIIDYWMGEITGIGHKEFYAATNN